MLDSSTIVTAVNRTRSCRPLVQCIPNVVAAEITANVLMAAGAAPAMVIGIEEAPEFLASKAAALSINCGALTAAALASMRETATAASTCERRPPWVLDPVACGGTAHRTAACRELLALRPTVVRGNASEVMALAGATGASGPRGVDASDPVEAALPVAAALARQHGGMLVVVTGQTDFVTDGEKTIAVRGGNAAVTQVTGTGCAFSALLIAFVAAARAAGSGGDNGLGPLEYAAACCAFYKACASVAAADGCPGPGTFKVRLLDALAMPASAIAAAASGVSVAAHETPRGD